MSNPFSITSSASERLDIVTAEPGAVTAEPDVVTAEPDIFTAKPDSFTGEPKETPDILLTNFLRSTEIMLPNPPAQQMLREILHDSRWNRRMLEDWFKQGAISGRNPFPLTPDPEHRALYLVVLSILDDRTRAVAKAVEANKEATKSSKTQGEREGEARKAKLEARIADVLGDQFRKS